MSCLGFCCQLATSLTFLLPFEQCAALEAHTTVFLPLSKALKSHRNIFWSRFLGSLYIKDFSSWCSDVLLILCRNFFKLVGSNISFQQLFEVFHCDSWVERASDCTCLVLLHDKIVCDLFANMLNLLTCGLCCFLTSETVVKVARSCWAL